MVYKEDLNGADKRKILESFVENDDALGLLLDFISNKHLKKPGSYHNQSTPAFKSQPSAMYQTANVNSA